MRWIKDRLLSLEREGLERKLSDTLPVAGKPGFVIRGGQTLLQLSSNDYLGLSQHPEIVEAMRNSLVTEYEAGAGASRLVTGNRALYRKLEEELADWQQCDASLVFANGYMANLGVISALVGRGDVVFSDRLNHASIVDGITLSRAEHARYRHNDMNHLRSLLHKHRDARRKLIVTDSIFSMDGDAAPLCELTELKREYGAMLMVDEAHSGGIYGPRGEGLCHSIDAHRDVDVHMGTFSKAFGMYGAYVSGSSSLIRWLTNKARPLIYSTALPPSVIAGIRKALEIVQISGERRKSLAEASGVFRFDLRAAGFEVRSGHSPIIPIMIGDNRTALRFSEKLEAEGIAAVAIRPPTVPEGTARIRCSVSAVHTLTDLRDAASKFKRLGLELGVLHGDG